MDIHQLSVNYLQEQDRILVRINTRGDEEIRLWLTRRLCLGWLPALRHSAKRLQPAAQEGSVPALAGVPPSEQAPPAHDFQTPFKEHPRSLPLGSEPLLITTVHMALKPGARLDIRFEESLQGKTRQARGFQTSLESSLALGLLHLLEQALAETDWRLEDARSQAPGAYPGASDDEDPPEVEAVLRGKTAKYLH